MSSKGHFRPTLLVGVGGTGSRIAEGILAQAIENDSSIQGRVRIIALDTDANDIAKLKNIPKRGQIQFSQPETVYRLIERNARAENDWLYSRKAPEMTQTILGMSLIEGAGQIRMLTRLALHDSFVNLRLLERFEAAIGELGVHGDDQGFAGAVHILVVGSLAGATGSGSFAQVALALKQAARNRTTQATVRGVFLLPDVYVRSGALPVSQAPNVMANGYAALKELNAINVRAHLPQRKSDFSFEYLPGHDLMAGSSPFEAVTFIDYENSIGGSMGRNINAYVNMAARAGYLMIFSPLGASYGSVTINDVRQKLAAIASGSTNLYSGIGVAALKYPVDSVRRFLSRNLVLDNLKGDWMRLDQAYRDQVLRFKQQQAAGQTGSEEPELRKTYLRDLEQLAREEPRIPFFRAAHDFLFPEIEDEKTFERTVRPRHIAFADATNDYVRRSFWAADDTKAVERRGMLDASSLLESDSLVDTVRRAEADLDRDLRTLEAALQSRPEDIYQNALITADGLGNSTGEWAAHHVQSYIFDKKAHPVTVRAFLYLARDEIVKRRDALNLPALKLSLYRIGNVFRDEDEIQSTNNRPASRSTPRVVERATKSEEGSILGRLLNNKKKAFAEEYVEYFNRSLTQMRQYANSVIAAKVCDQSIAELNALIRVFEGLFTEIETIADALRREIEVSRASHSGGGGPDGNAFVYADAACMDDAWARLAERAQGQKLDDQVNVQLVRAVFEKHREDKRLRQASPFKQLNEMFWTKVVDGFGQGSVDNDHASVFNFSVIEAIRRQFAVEDRLAATEAAARGEPAPRAVPVAERLKRMVDRTSRQSVPYVTLRRPETDGTPIKFWALHPRCQADLADDQLFADMFQAEDGNKPIVEEDFSIHDLTCVNLRVNLELQHLSKLGMGADGAATIHAETEGRYATAYGEMVQRMLDQSRSAGPGAEFTPHVDRRWHAPGALPEIFAELEQKISGNNAKAHVIARMHGLILLDTDHGTPQARFSSIGHGLRGGVDEDIVASHDPWLVQQAFMGMGHVVQAAVDFWTALRERPAAGLASHPSWAALTNPVLLFGVIQPAAARNRDAEARDEAGTKAIEAWIQTLDELIEAQGRNLTPRARRQALEAAVQKVRTALFDHIAQEGYGPETTRVFDKLFRVAFDQALGQ